MPSRRDENYANMQRYNSVMHRALLALLAAAGLIAQQLPFDAQALLELARIGDPQVSPDGRLVAFQVQTIDVPNNKRVTQIYVKPVAGGAARQITQAGQDNERPRWSPDSRRIAFVSDRGGASQIWLMERRRKPRRRPAQFSEADGRIAGAGRHDCLHAPTHRTDHAVRAATGRPDSRTPEVLSQE